MEGWLHCLPVHGSRANGPGLRSVVWVQGCAIRCPGCHNPETHVFYGRVLMDSDSLAQELAVHAVDGVSWSGGEPMHQARFVLEVMEKADRLAERRGRGRISWGLFSGYTEQELEEGRFLILRRGRPQPVEPAEGASLWKRIREKLDFAVLGPYMARLRTPGSMLASANQVLRIYGSASADMDTGALDEILIDGSRIVRTGFGSGWLIRLDKAGQQAGRKEMAG